MTTTEHNLTDEQVFYVAGLHELADFLASHPDYISRSKVEVVTFTDERGEFLALSRALRGTRDKRAWGSYYETMRSFGPHQIVVSVPREQVCRKVVTGTRVVPATEETTEETYEWECDPVILSADS